MSQSGELDVIKAHPEIATQYITDNGTAVPDLNTLYVLGQNGVTTSGGGDTITIELDGSVADTYTADSGTASPSLGNINIFGSSVAAGTSPVSTTASGDTVTLNTQISQAIASTDATRVGLAAFDSASFAVDANGFVTLSGGSAVDSVTGTLNRIDVSPTTGNVVVDISASYVGQSSITTLGTITTGVWNGTAVGATYGGTAQTSWATGDLLYASGVNTLAKLAASTNGFVLTLAAGVPTWAANGNGDVVGPASATNNAICLFDLTTGKLIKNSVVTISATGAYASPGGVTLTNATASTAIGVNVINSDTNAASTAQVQTLVDSGSAADPFFTSAISAGVAWSWGLDNSNNDNFVLSASATLGTQNIFVVSPSTFLTTFQNGNLSINRSNSGATNQAFVGNSESSTGTSNAQVAIQTNGASSGDPYLSVLVNGQQGYSLGIDNSDSDKLKIVPSSSGPSSGGDLWSLTSSGECTLPLQPAFLVYVDTTIPDVTGDGTVYTVIYDTEVFDQGADFNIATGVFTAPVTGKYRFDLVSRIIGGTGLTANGVNYNIVTSNRTFRATPGGGSVNVSSMTSCVLCDMDAGDTASVTLQATDSGGKVDDVAGTTSGEIRNWFSGNLVC